MAIRIARLLLTLSVMLVLPVVNAEESDSTLKDIRARYAEIENAKLRTKIVKFDSETERVSGVCTLSFQQDKLVKVKLSYDMGDHGGSDEYFYYRDGVLIFAFATDSSWQFGGKPRPDGGAGTIDTVAEHRVYFAKGKMLQHLAKEVSSADAKAIPALLAKTPNKDSEDAERAQSLKMNGDRAYLVRTSADLGKLLTESD